ncbi:uncharacterized protein LAESUDRAFT_813670 [Laetiporus sulphureus 93-53]|uniref:ATPase inhibitor, mitochondrial n=1 Tax=Laetiporus sulphureus 93-53 TaxID=1314785 RepID=A0A165DJL3_9APHY|nr:uncharacterized protein LAESUDRAFT_813670 [Laetiporus sulphureus 93-53]KZT05025.1 hypothetical protein LAESUDRAFT_813670 [Laetiporus sulphureus 93-53]
MLARFTAISARRVPRVAPAGVRFYSPEDKLTNKERGEENIYVRQQEKEQLKKLKAAIEAKKKELADLEKQHAEVEKNSK